MYKEVRDDLSYLIDAMHRALEKIRMRDDIDINTLKYFDEEEPKFRFYLLLKIHKRLQSVPGRPIISYSGFYTKSVLYF